MTRASPAAKARRRPRRPATSRRRRRPKSKDEIGHVTTSSSSKGPKVPYRCSFCGKSQDQVRKLIAGQGVYICDECITLCREIVDEEFMEAPKARTLGQKIPSPRRINEIL